MPYFISDTAEGCDGWATVKDDGEVMGCHVDKQSAIDQGLAIAQAEGSTFEGERAVRVPVPGIDKFTTEEEALDRAEEIGCEGTHTMDEDGQTIYMPCSTHAIYDALTSGNEARPYEDEEDERGALKQFKEAVSLSYANKPGEPKAMAIRQVNLDPPAYMRAAARRGLQYYSEGKAGSGLQPRTVAEARAMARGNVTADKWVRIRAWIARHLGDLRSPNADPASPNYPSPGVVAHLLWGSGPSIRAAERALAYAEGVVGRLEEENKGRARGKALSALEVRVNVADWELRETAEGMTFEGYAAVFNSPSEPLMGSPRGSTFTERIAPGAFLRSLKSRNDIKLLWNHDTSDVLGSTRAGTMKLVEDGRGLRVTAELPNTTLGRDAAELLKRGDVDAMSFGFTVPRGGDEWNAEGTERTLREVMLHEVSIVAFPAYSETAGTATVRGLAKIAQRAQVDVDALSDALLKLENGEEMTEEDAKLLSEVLDSIAPEKPDEPEEPEEPAVEEVVGDMAMLELKKKKLELLLKGY